MEKYLFLKKQNANLFICYKTTIFVPLLKFRVMGNWEASILILSNTKD